MKRLTPEKMAELALGALANARRLFDDARTLRDAERTASAFVLAGLAMDELGKHVLVTSFFGVRDESDAEWNKFWRRFRSHTDKRGNALLSGWVGDLLTDDPPPSVSAFHKRCLDATYVDLAPDDSVMMPSETITESELNGTLVDLARELERCESTLRGSTAAQLGASLAAMRSSDLAEQLRELIGDVGMAGAMAYAIALRGGLDHEDALRFAQEAAYAVGDAVDDDRSRATSTD